MEIYHKLIKKGEGSISHMYLDTVGKVTVGVGNMLPNIGAALSLPFLKGDNRATSEEIEKDFNNISAMSKGKNAGFYKDFAQCHLSVEAINELLNERLSEFEQYLMISFPGFDRFPINAKQGLMDMVFNLGYNGLKTKFPTFMRHAKDQNWSGCADECKRKGISDSRNDEVKALFLDASGE